MSRGLPWAMGGTGRHEVGREGVGVLLPCPFWLGPLCCQWQGPSLTQFLPGSLLRTCRSHWIPATRFSVLVPVAEGCGQSLKCPPSLGHFTIDAHSSLSLHKSSFTSTCQVEFDFLLGPSRLPLLKVIFLNTPGLRF